MFLVTPSTNPPTAQTGRGLSDQPPAIRPDDAAMLSAILGNRSPAPESPPPFESDPSPTRWKSVARIVQARWRTAAARWDLSPNLPEWMLDELSEGRRHARTALAWFQETWAKARKRIQ